ncbi:MAG TPA: S8 family serine peptidase [Candidatus Limnocylindria bacterium]|nr:S8 family serine peptidase [Candidatus Limnocylindria bacterium]
MNLRSVSFCLALVAAVTLAGCGGGGHSGSTIPGGGGSGPTPGPSSTYSPGVLGFASAGGGHGGGQCPAGSASWGCPSVYALSSDPTGIQVKRVDPTNQDAGVDVTLTTPANDPLPDSSTNLQYQFASNSAAGTFNVAVQQIHDGPHQVYYNRNEDSTGTVDASQLQAIVRTAQSTLATTAVSHATSQLRRLPFKAATAVNASDRVYVRFNAASLRSAGRSVADAVRALGTTGTELPTTNSDPLAVVAVPSGMTAQAYAQQLQSQAGVAAVFPVRKRYALSRTETLPNDPTFTIPNQWYLYTDGFPYAWSYTQGSSATIAVIDTGVDLTNTDLSQNVVFSEQVLNGVKTSTEIDEDGHGTNVAGIADAAVGNGTAFGINSTNINFAGGGYNAKLIAIRIFSAPNDPSGEGALGSDEAIAIGDAVAHNADVINLSLGGEESFSDSGTATNWNGGYDEGEYEAVEAAISAGTTVVAAAGNNRDGQDGGDGLQHNNLDYPAAYAGVIAVGASQLNDNNTGTYSTSTESVAPYSQSGVGLALVAPGGDALNDPSSGNPDLLHWIWNYYSTAASPSTGGQACTYGQGSLPTAPENCTALFNGTSQATPQVSAAAALLIAAAGGHHALQPAQVAQILEDTADNINDPNQGHGRLNVYRAVASLVGDTGAIATGPQATTHSATQAIAFAYDNSGSNRPTILDYDYPIGVPISSTGTFRIADVRPGDASSYKVGVWYDANGNGIVDAGDSFGASSATCTTTTACQIGTIRLQPVSGGFTLP